MTNQDEKLNEELLGKIPNKALGDILNKARQQGTEAERKRIIDSGKVFLICDICGFKGEVMFDDIAIHKNGHCYLLKNSEAMEK